MSPTIKELYDLSNLFPEILNLTPVNLHRLLTSAAQLHHFTQIQQRRTDSLPLPYPSRPVAALLAQVGEIPQDSVDRLWVALYPWIQSYEIYKPDIDLAIFRTLDLPAETIASPVAKCPGSSCQYRSLVSKPGLRGHVLTLNHGVLPVFCPSVYCSKCNTYYYYNYAVSNASHSEAQRVYYASKPKYLEISDHLYADEDLCQWIRMEYTFAQSSSMNIARVYQLSLSQLPPDHALLSSITGETILYAFLLHGLLQDKQQQNECLSLPHTGHNRKRLNTALKERNERRAGTGHSMWAHACNLCTKIICEDDGVLKKISAGVVDGVTVGHPCCGVLNCETTLSNQNDRFCIEHSDWVTICAVSECSDPIITGRMTCQKVEHQAWEDKHLEDNPAIGQLKARLLRNQERKQASKSPSTAKKSKSTIKGQLTRKWTHNEELFVKCCGVIISRKTFFGSESIINVKNFLKETFPQRYPLALPDYIFYDNNCQLTKHLQSSGDSYFSRSGLAVDVFHFKSKHKETDVHCQTYCNPASFPELMDADGKSWTFNSSAAEQINAWFGGFNSVVKEMVPERYNFFLDEVIQVRNEWLVGELQRKGHKPYLVPIDALSDLSNV